jgi:hypothetical protein
MLYKTLETLCTTRVEANVQDLLSSAACAWWPAARPQIKNPSKTDSTFTIS